MGILAQTVFQSLWEQTSCNFSEKGHNSVSTWQTKKRNNTGLLFLLPVRLTNIKALGVMVLEK